MRKLIDKILLKFGCFKIPAESKTLYIRLRDAQNFTEWQRLKLKYFKDDHSLKNTNAIFFSFENHFTPFGFEISDDQFKVLRHDPLSNITVWCSGIKYFLLENQVNIQDELIL